RSSPSPRASNPSAEESEPSQASRPAGPDRPAANVPNPPRFAPRRDSGPRSWRPRLKSNPPAYDRPVTTLPGRCRSREEERRKRQGGHKGKTPHATPEGDAGSYEGINHAVLARSSQPQ